MTIQEIRGRAMHLMRTEIARLEGELAQERQEQDELQEKMFQLSESMTSHGPVAARLHEIEQCQHEVSYIQDRMHAIDAKLAKSRMRLLKMERRSDD
jgi:ubiquinone biosynthesis protein UbiJ